MYSIIVITFPHFIPKEIEGIVALFEEGLACLHLRKPHASSEEVAQFIEQIPYQYHARIVLHSHHDLVNKFALKGIHFTSQHQKPVFIPHKNLTYSQSVHSFAEITALDKRIDYVFLSPIFDSISKENYLAAFAETELRMFLQDYQGETKVVALGGIHAENIQLVYEYGFRGAAVLGYLWQDFVQNTDSLALKKRFHALLKT